MYVLAIKVGNQIFEQSRFQTYEEAEQAENNLAPYVENGFAIPFIEDEKTFEAND